MYRVYGLICPGSPFDLDVAADRLRARLPDAAVTRSGDQLTVERGEWEIELLLNAGPDVRTESIALAERLAGLEDGVELEACDRRVDVWSDTPDRFVEHLSDFHAVVDVLRTFPGVIPVDPTEPALL